MFDRLANISEKMGKKLLEDKVFREHSKIKDEEKHKDPYWFFALLISTHNCSDEVRNKFDSRVSGATEFPFDLYFRLLSCACHCNMLDELKELLAITEYKFDINEILPIDSFYALKILSSQSVMPQETLLGIAAYEGYLDIVEYLVDEQKANVDADTDANAYTPLHQSVRGDADRSHDPSCPCPLHRKFLSETRQISLGNQHSEIAAFLIAHNADLSIVSTNSKTAHELALNPLAKISKSWMALSVFDSFRTPAPEKNIRKILAEASKKSEQADVASEPIEFSYQRLTPW